MLSSPLKLFITGFVPDQPASDNRMVPKHLGNVLPQSCGRIRFIPPGFQIIVFFLKQPA